MSEVRLDGLLRVHAPHLLTTLAPPWSLVEHADELVPFLVARTGQALDAFVRWVKTRRPLPWLFRVLESLPMSAATYEDLSNFTLVKTDDPEVRARRHMILSRFLEVLPEAREKLV